MLGLLLDDFVAGVVRLVLGRAPGVLLTPRRRAAAAASFSPGRGVVSGTPPTAGSSSVTDGS